MPYFCFQDTCKVSFTKHVIIYSGFCIKLDFVEEADHFVWFVFHQILCFSSAFHLLSTCIENRITLKFCLHTHTQNYLSLQYSNDRPVPWNTNSQECEQFTVSLCLLPLKVCLISFFARSGIFCISDNNQSRTFTFFFLKCWLGKSLNCYP